MTKRARLAVAAAASVLIAATGAPAPIAVAKAPVCTSLAGMDTTVMQLAPPVLADGVTAERTDSYVYSRFSVSRTHLPQKLLTSVSATHGQVFVTKDGNRVNIGALTLRITKDGKPLLTLKDGKANLGFHQAAAPADKPVLDALTAKAGGKIGLSYADASDAELLRFEFDAAAFAAVLNGCKPM